MTLSLSWMWSYILHRSSFFTLLVDPTPKHHGLREDSGFQTPVCTLYNNLIQCASNTDVNTNHWAFYFSWKFWFSASIVEPETDVFIRCWSTDCTLSIKILHHIFKGLVRVKTWQGSSQGLLCHGCIATEKHWQQGTPISSSLGSMIIVSTYGSLPIEYG
jgi:hypothetical protein